MTRVSLVNPGLIPLEAVTTLGINAKENDNPIGFFGTGLKYAIAGLLRLKHEIVIWRGLDRYDFTVESGEVRGRDFDFIRMTGPGTSERLGFTTRLGINWETWQIFRELYSNCLDENGELSFANVEPREGWTTINVVGADFHEAARDRDRYFLDSDPIYKGHFVEIHPGASDSLYYRGVLIAKQNQESAYTYNITSDMTLTEDRTLRYPFLADSMIAEELARCTDRGFLNQVLRQVDAREATLAFNVYDVGEAFAETVEEISEREGSRSVIPKAVAVAEAWAQQNARVREVDLSADETDKLEQAFDWLELIGHPVKVKIKVVESLGPSVAGMVKGDEIFITRATVNRGRNFLVGTLLEKNHQRLAPSENVRDLLVDLVLKFVKEIETC